MQDLYKDIPCIYFSASADGVILEANATLCLCLGYNRDELVGRKLESLFTLATRIFQQTHFYPLLQLTGHAEEIYITLTAKDGGDVPVLINAIRKENDGQARLHFAGIALNKRQKFEEEIIAAKKSAEKALNENTALKAAQEELQKRAEELDSQFVLVNLQNQELKQFGHLATHTFQEPLRKLLFFSSQILKPNQGEQTITAANKIRKAALDMDAKLKGLQQYIWLTNEGVKWEEVDLLRVIESARKAVEVENPGVSIILESEVLPLIEANSAQMLYLMKELLTNSVKFRKSGSVVNVRIYASTLLMNMFRRITGKYKYAEFIKLEIQDNGIGFDDEYQAQAFELFRKLHAISGAGIGLALCRKIVENHSGTISLESQDGIGTRVIVFLPLQQEKIILPK